MELVAGGGVKISLLGCNMRVDKLYLGTLPSGTGWYLNSDSSHHHRTTGLESLL